MVLSESIQFITILGVTLAFTVFSFMDIEQKIIMKIIAGICWFMLSVTSLFFFGVGELLSIPLMLMFLAFGMIFSFSIVTDFKNKKRDQVWNFD